MVNRRLGGIAVNLVLAVAVGLLALGSGSAIAREDQSATKGLFATTNTRGSIDASDEPTVIRSRYVQLNLELLLNADGAPHELKAEGNTLTLNLFDDVTLQVVLDRAEPAYGGGFTWAGQVQDEPLSLVTLAVSGGVMAGTVLLPGRVFEIGYAGNGVHAVYEIDQSAFPPDAEPIPVDLPEGVEVDTVPSAVADDGSVIDVMVVYTPRARQYQGGTTAMQTLINSAISQTNSTYGNSQIAQRLRLVYTAEVSYTESGSLPTDLERLRIDGDTYMDIVHTWRDTYGADEVALIVEYPSSYSICGAAYLMATLTVGFEDRAFAAVKRTCTTANLTFAHELGHNMGAHHDWYVNDSTDLYTYSHGKVNVYAGWYTIMSYYNECYRREYPCTRIPYWSNPNQYYSSAVLGVPGGTSTSCGISQPDPPCDADNHRTLNESAWYVANFRQSVVGVPAAPTGLTATPVLPWEIRLSWTDNSYNESGFRIQRSLNGSTWNALATVGANRTSYSDMTATPDVTYYYRVLAYNSAGTSDPSNTASALLPAVVGPLVYDGRSIDDDDEGDTSGDGFGVVECGETIGLTVRLFNEGNTTAEDVWTSLDVVRNASDIVMIDTTSAYPDIGGGARAGNYDQFTFSVDADAEHGHWLGFELEITMSNGDDDSAAFSLPIMCADTADYRFYIPLIAR